MSAWCKVWYEPVFPVICDLISRMHADMPEEAAAFRAKRRECIRKAEEQENRLIPLFGAPILVKLESNRPSFESVCQAFDKVHVLCATSSDRNDFSEKPSPIEQLLMDAQALVLKKSGKKKRSFKVYKRNAEEKKRGLNEAKFPNYVREFDGEWNDIEDIILHEDICKIKSKRISRLKVKGTDWDWRWIPAECVNPDLIEDFLKERDDHIDEASDSSLSSAIDTTSDTVVIWNVRQVSRSHMPSGEGIWHIAIFRDSEDQKLPPGEGILDIARFRDLEDANKCAEQRFENLCTNGTRHIWKRYRFGNRFIGYVSINETSHDDMFVWVEKEVRTVSAHVLQWDIDEGSSMSISKTKFTPDTSEGYSSACKTKFTPDSSDGSLKAMKDDNEFSPEGGTKASERVQDGQDFFQMLKTHPLLKFILPQSNPDVPTGYSRTMGSSIYIGNLEREAGSTLRLWTSDWKRIRQRRANEGKERRVILKNGKVAFEYV